MTRGRKFWRAEELTNRQEVRDASNGQRNDKGWRADVTELARADRQCHKQDGAKPVQPAGWREFHSFPELVRNCVTACPHCSSQTAVRGALAGAIRSSAARRVKSSSTSMS